MGKRRSQTKSKSDRKMSSTKVQSDLSSIILDNDTMSIEVKQNAAEKLVALNRKHRLKMPKQVGLMICKKCQILYDTNNSRTRIKHGQLIISCFKCESVRRIGGGPKSHRRR